MTTFADFIKSKGIKQFGDALRLKPTYVRVMLSKNYISRHQWPDILLVYPEVGLNDLIAMESASKAQG